MKCALLSVLLMFLSILPVSASVPYHHKKDKKTTAQKGFPLHQQANYKPATKPTYRLRTRNAQAHHARAHATSQHAMSRRVNSQAHHPHATSRPLNTYRH